VTLFSLALAGAGGGRSAKGVAGVCACAGVLGVVREDDNVATTVSSCTLQVLTAASSTAADENRSFLSTVHAEEG